MSTVITSIIQTGGVAKRRRKGASSEVFFTVVFALEQALKFFALRRKNLQDPWSIFDSFLVRALAGDGVGKGPPLAAFGLAFLGVCVGVAQF